MTTLSNRPKPWEVWLAYVRFADNPKTGKVRPVVMLEGLEAAFVVAKVTSAAPLDHYDYCELEDWEDEGLLRPSRVQLAPLIRVGVHDLLNGEPIGVLSDRDKKNLNEGLSKSL